MLSLSFITTVSLAANTVLLLMLAPIQPRRTPFGVDIPREKVTDPAIAAAKRSYSALVAVMGLVTCAAANIPPASKTVWPLILGSITLTAVSIIGWRLAARRIRTQGWKLPHSGIVGNITGTSLSQLPPGQISWAPHIMALIINLACALILVASWDKIPEVFATHFSASGQADGFSTKGPAVFFPLIMGLLLIALSLGISWVQCSGIARMRHTTGAQDRARLHALMRTTEQGSAWLLSTLAAMIAVLGVALALPDHVPLPPGNSGAWVALFLIVGLLGPIVMIAWGISAGDRAAAATEPNLDAPEENTGYDRAAHLKWGMFYYNPDDPALFVDKAIGVGIDFNYAHWPAKVFLVAITVIVVVPLVLAFI